MIPPKRPKKPSAPATLLPPLADAAPAQAILLMKKELVAVLPMPVRSIERLVANKVIPVHRIPSRMVRFRLAAVLAALDRYQTSTLRR